MQPFPVRRDEAEKWGAPVGAPHFRERCSGTQTLNRKFSLERPLNPAFWSLAFLIRTRFCRRYLVCRATGCEQVRFTRAAEIPKCSTVALILAEFSAHQPAPFGGFDQPLLHQ